MWAFFAKLLRNVGADLTIVVMDAEGRGQTRRYHIRPFRMILAWGGSLIAAGFVVGLLLVFTPLRTQIPGYGTKQLEKSARLNTVRLQSLQDSLAAQRQYVKRLRRLITGRVDSVATMRPQGRSSAAPAQPERGQGTDGEDSEQNIHGQPALGASVSSRPVAAGKASTVFGLSFPLPPPVNSGFPTRDFNARTGHYGIDVAVSEGEYIRSVGDGYVVWADWTQDGGYTIAVQHADGYLSVYKHNGRLLKHLGDDVQAQEPIAVSGNTGAITTGPHLHFELWRNGLAQGPQSYIAGW